MMLIADLHTHTVASGHAYSTLLENAAYAAKRRLSVLGISDHAPAMLGTTGPFYFHNMRIWPRQIHGLQILRGAEVNILDQSGAIDLPAALLEQLDYVIASLHTGIFPMGLGAARNTDAAIAALSQPKVCALGHPDDSRFPLEYDRLAAAARRRGVALELNNSSLSPQSYRENGVQNASEMLRACMRQGTGVLVSTDSHIATAIGVFDRALELLRNEHFPEFLIVNGSLSGLSEFLARAVSYTVLADIPVAI